MTDHDDDFTSDKIYPIVVKHKLKHFVGESKWL